METLTKEEARWARERREARAFAQAMRRHTELQQRSVWQRIKALMRGGK